MVKTSSAGGHRMGRFLSSLLSILIFGAAIGYFGAPYYGFFALRDAAQANDAQGLVQLVDYDAVRGSLRDQVSPGAPPPGPPPSVWQDPIGALRRSLEPMTASPTADSYLTPQALAALTRGEGREARTARPGVYGHPLSRPWPAYSYWGPNRARLSVRTDAGATVFTWERRAIFTWKLVHIGLPEGPVAADPAAPAPRAAPTPAPATK